MNRLKALKEFGQSIWLDYVQRSLIASGELGRLVAEDGLCGVTSNPTIFEKAITGSRDYDKQLQAILAGNTRAEPATLYELLAVQDIQMAADVLRPVYDITAGADGFVSLEASPHLAHDTGGTLAEVRRLWRAVGRPNVMIKVPATPEGIPAVETLIAEGININITLMFSLRHYEAVARAYLSGLGRCAAPERVASVASFFVSRVDTVVDRAIEEIGTRQALELRGKIAIANAKLVYRRFREIFDGEAFSPMRRKGARVQRPLWGSTGTKNPAYSDVLYVEGLIGPDTVNTLPPATLDAFRDHGQASRATVDEAWDKAESCLEQLKELGIDLTAVTERLQSDGVAAFAASYDQLLTALSEKRKTIIARHLDQQSPGVREE
ncbi:MAG: transaldolase [Deltaproteobacteria bacterium]|nr:transaldolase [Deltaproteobacteria bacterium]